MVATLFCRSPVESGVSPCNIDLQVLVPSAGLSLAGAQGKPLGTIGWQGLSKNGEIVGKDMSKQFWRPPRNYYDQDKLRKKQETLQLLKEILESTADENDFVEAVKSVNPSVSAEELAELIKLFHASVREKRGLGRGEP